jgi:uncharacterized protein YukE
MEDHCEIKHLLSQWRASSRMEDILTMARERLSSSELWDEYGSLLNEETALTDSLRVYLLDPLSKVEEPLEEGVEAEPIDKSPKIEDMSKAWADRFKSLQGKVSNLSSWRQALVSFWEGDDNRAITTALQTLKAARSKTDRKLTQMTNSSLEEALQSYVS